MGGKRTESNNKKQSVPHILLMLASIREGLKMCRDWWLEELDEGSTVSHELEGWSLGVHMTRVVAYCGVAVAVQKESIPESEHHVQPRHVANSMKSRKACSRLAILIKRASRGSTNVMLKRMISKRKCRSWDTCPGLLLAAEMSIYY